METESRSEQEQAVIGWFQQQALPIQHVEARHGFADLQPLKQILGGVKVVGLGETTHGTREFFQFKHRLLEFLVIEMGFTAFAIEASYSACQPINDYVLYGKGDREHVLTGQWYTVWDTEEVAAMLDWMRAYNQTVSDAKKVRFYGVDITRSNIGRQAVLDYLRAVAPEKLAATEPLFEALGTEDAKWPLRIDDEAEKTMEQLLPRLQNLIDDLSANKDALVSRSSLAAFDQAVRYLTIMKQWLITNSSYLRLPALAGNQSRSLSMADNLIYLVDQAAPDAKFVLWEHNYHIGVDDAETPNMGCRLREKYGQAYYAFGFEYEHGSCQTRLRMPEENLLGDLKEVSLAPSPQGSLPWSLARTNVRRFMVNLRVSIGDGLVQEWFDALQKTHWVGWVYDPTLQYYEDYRILKRYDGLIFIDGTTASRPNPNALKMIAQRDGL